MLGNCLVGNAPDAVALEISLAGPTLVADEPLGVVVYGAPFDLGPYAPGQTFTLPAGQPLRIGGTAQGMRAYVCIAGGFVASPVLGSCSSLEPLQAGMQWVCPGGQVPGRRIPLPTMPSRLRILPGTHASLFEKNLLAKMEFRVGSAADRMGVRLEGPALPVPGELPSEPVGPGAIQVTRDGQCIILGVDGQTIGGYPQIAQVIAADWDSIGQLRPGQQIRLQAVSLEAAERAWETRTAELRQWRTRLGQWT
jgi:allophanate hydrolase subunit 2